MVMIRRFTLALTVLAATLSGASLAAPPAQARSDCTIQYAPTSGVYTPGGCWIARFRLDASTAPRTVTGTIGRQKVSLNGGPSISGRIGSQKVSLSHFAGPYWVGKIGKQKVRIDWGPFGGIACAMGGKIFVVSTPLTSYGVLITDNNQGAVCLALLLTADLMDEI